MMPNVIIRRDCVPNPRGADDRSTAASRRSPHARVIRRHRLLNQPLIVLRDGEVVHLDPHTVPMPEGVTEEEMGPVFDYL